jgi:hypothetical protein
VTKKAEVNEYVVADGLAREIRLRVAGDLRELVAEADRMGSLSEVGARIERVNYARRMIREAKGRQLQAREMGNPTWEHVKAAQEWCELLREAVMQLAVSCATWAAAMDLQEARMEQDRVRADGDAEPTDGA